MRPIRTGFSILALATLPVMLAAGADDTKPNPNLKAKLVVLLLQRLLSASH